MSYALELIDGYLQSAPETKPMTFEEARIWSYDAAHYYSPNTIWGVYTPLEDDASYMAYQVGGFIKLGHSEIHINRKKYKPPFFKHYHTPNHSIDNRTTKFHSWFGPAYT